MEFARKRIWPEQGGCDQAGDQASYAGAAASTTFGSQ
jgi:hypothetical protein